ncbi:MAG TPA: methyltransferase [Planctomycetota bacterium]|nr:methyltransferase [Planctomycetota bacterium]
MSDGPATPVLVLGDPARAQVHETLRAGRLSFESRRGLRVPERLLVESLPEAAPGRTLTGFDTEGAVALAARAIWGPGPEVEWLHLDAYVARKVEAVIARNAAKDVRVLCAPDVPGATAPGEAPVLHPPFDLVALPFPRSGEALLGRELIEEAHAALAIGGRFLAATDNPGGDWLRKVVKEVFGKVGDQRREKRGVAFVATRTREKAVVRDHRHVVRVAGLELETRPGVFGHDRIDGGTRALAERLDVREGERVLDLGCGYGPLGLAAARQAREVVLVDSNARAVLLAGRNATRNKISNAHALLRADLEDLGDEPFDLALANPPYFSNYRIARSFVERAHAVLRKGGRLALVAKAAEEHAAIAREVFGGARVDEAPGGYGIITAVKVS